MSSTRRAPESARSKSTMSSRTAPRPPIAGSSTAPSPAAATACGSMFDGNLWCAWSGGEAEDGVVVFAPDGKMIGRIMLSERCANLAFGGKKRNRLFMTASQSVYSLYVEVQGAVGG